MRIFITGAEGMLGRRLVEEARRLGHRVAAFDRPELELGRPEEAAALLRADHPELLIHGAAMTDVDGCESEEAAAMLVNGEASRVLAEAASQLGARCIYISSDYVFDGMSDAPYLESDPTGPRSVYGRSKLLGEQGVLAAGGSVVRLSWSFGPDGKNFVKTIAELLLAGRQLRVVDDQHGGPTFTRDSATALLALGAVEHDGVYHLCNSGYTSWFGFARAIARELGVAEDAVSPCGSDEYPRPAPRPASSRLGGTRLARALGELEAGEPMPSWQDALRRYIEEEGWVKS